MQELKCFECGEHFETGKKLSNHFKKIHGLTSEEYAIKHVHNNVRPMCANCGDSTRFVSALAGYKSYCVKCKNIVAKVSGKKGGKLKKTWNKGETKETNEKIAQLAIRSQGEGNPFFGQQHTDETRMRISTSKLLKDTDIWTRLNQRKDEFELITSISDYVSRQRQYLEFKCVKCGTIQPKTLQAFERGSRCYTCHPISKSNWELEVYNFVKLISSDAVSGDRSVISPKEIDIYVPSKKFGIECHGLYWHSEGSPRGETIDKRTHLKKLELAQAVSVRLLQLFEDEWRDKKIICQSMIRHRLGVTEHKIGARNLNVVKLTSSERKLFFENSHISGDVPASQAWGLKRDDKIFAAISVRKPRQAKKYPETLEVARYSTCPNYSVPGGLQKLFKEVFKHARSEGIKKIMTYVDKRIGDGHGYKKSGFDLVGSTGIDYSYTDNELRYDRFSFRAQGEMSETQIVKEAKVSKIYGCGSYVYMNVI